MGKRILFIGLIMICMTSYGLQKQLFDITENSPTANNDPPALARIPYPGIDFVELGNDLLEADLLRSGHFTLGTTAGTDQGPYDDHQSLTFGHPLAKTSYPILEIDEISYRLDTYFSDSEISIATVGTDQLRLSASNPKLEALFTISLSPGSAPSLQLSLTLTNRDSQNHSVRCGFVMDPALGTWGDGAISIASVPILDKTLYENNTSIATIQIDERRFLNTGMRIFLNFPPIALPAEILVDNWPSMTGYSELAVPELYDAAIQWYSTPQTLSTNETTSSECSLELSSCDYPAGPFMRAQLPQMLESFDNLVSPSQFNCFTVIANSASASVATLTLRSDYLFDEWSSLPFSVYGFGETYQRVPMDIPERYEDRVYPLTLELTSGTNLLDVIEQNILVPASAFSDTGLLVVADSVLLGDYPDLSTRFNVTEVSTGQYFLGLQNDNLLVWEGQSRIFDFSLIPDTSSGVNAADVVFVLDVTGSMSEEIAGVKNNLSAFASALEAAGVDFRLAMVTFLDVIENTYDFTSDVTLFQSYVNAQYAHGGGPIPENSLAALYAATQLQFRPEAGRIFIWITDAPYHINNEYTTLTPAQVVDAMLANSVSCHAVSGSDIRVQYCDPIIVPTGGDWFDINGNFLDILLEIADLGGTSNYLLSFNSPNPGPEARTITLEVHASGLGGTGTISYTPPSGFLSRRETPELRCFPNPFNPSIVIDLQLPLDLMAETRIYNVRGQLVKRFPATRGGPAQLTWDARDQQGQNLAAGLYLVQIRLLDLQGQEQSHEFIKIVHNN